MAASPTMLIALALLTLLVPLVARWIVRRQPSLANRLCARIVPSQEDWMIGFPLFIVFCGILMGWMLLSVGVVRHGMLP